MIKNSYGDFFIFCIMNVYVLECFRCVFIVTLRIISLTFIPYGWYFTALRAVVHHPCTWHAVNIRRYLGQHTNLYFPLWLKFLNCCLSFFPLPLMTLCLSVCRNQYKWNHYVRNWIVNDKISDKFKSHWKVKHRVQ